MLQLPKPYPDEAVGSVLLRAQRIYGISIKPLMAWIHGVNTTRSSHPFHLVTDVGLVSALCGMDPQEFLHRHTVFPYATACLPKQYAKTLEAKFLSATHGRPLATAPLVHNVTQGAPMRRYCLQCACDDTIRYGETYWHRLHQLPTVLLCPTHKTPLVQTGVRIGLSHGKHRVSFPSTDYVRPVAPLIEMPLALTLAQLSEDLLLGRFDRDVDWHESYQHRARALGFVHHYGQIASSVSAHALAQMYGTKYLELLRSEVKTPLGSSWPALLLRSSRDRFVSVVRHLLMQTFLEHARMDDHLFPLMARAKQAPRRDFGAIDQAAEKAIQREIARHVATGTRTTVGQLLAVAGINTIYRHNREKLPKTRELLTAFRATDQSARQLGGNEYWRARTPSRWGLPSKSRNQALIS